ncbi:MAG: outer membrane beta-barrel protein [Ferruginibacter sp.]
MKAILLFLFATISLSALAQHDTKSDYMPMGTLGVGMSFQKFEGLNSRIAGFSQYKALREYGGTLQLGFIKERNRIVSDAGIIAGSSMSGDKDKQSSTIRFIGVNAGIGYDLLKSDKLMLYPLAGLGFEKYQALFFKDNSGVAFNDVLQTPSIKNTIQPVDFKNSFFNYRLGVGFMVKGAKSSHCSIGFQAGYTGSFKSHEWRSSDNQVLMNAPSDNLSRFFVGIVFGSQPMMHTKQ